MAILIGLLTAVLILDCVILVFLVLLQLPKKEAGAGLAFGGSATDALFGAGSGTILTRVTKYATGLFLVLAIVLSILQSKYHRNSSSEFTRELSRTRATAAPANNPAASPVAPAFSTNATTNASPLLEVPDTGTNTLRSITVPSNTLSPGAVSNSVPPSK